MVVKNERPLFSFPHSLELCFQDTAEKELSDLATNIFDKQDVDFQTLRFRPSKGKETDFKANLARVKQIHGSFSSLSCSNAKSRINSASMMTVANFSNISEDHCSWPLHPGKTSSSDPSDLYLPLLVLDVILNCALSVVSVMGNALWIAAYTKTPSLQTPLNMCLLSLASVGLFNGVVMQPLLISDAIFFLASPSKTCSLEHIVTGILTLVADSTLQNIAVICIDRYIAILHGAKYCQLVTKKRIVIAFCSYALFRLFLSICVFTGVIDYTALVIASIVFSIAIVCFTGVRISLRIRRLGSVAVGPDNPEEERRKAQERKITKTVGGIVAIFAVCYVPALGYFFANKSTVINAELHAILWRFIETIMMLNAVFNFTVYFARHREKRAAVRKVINDACNAIKSCSCH